MHVTFCGEYTMLMSVHVTYKFNLLYHCIARYTVGCKKMVAENKTGAIKKMSGHDFTPTYI